MYEKGLNLTLFNPICAHIISKYKNQNNHNLIIFNILIILLTIKVYLNIL